MINTKIIKNLHGSLTFYSKESTIIPNQTDNHPLYRSSSPARCSNPRRGCRAQLPNAIPVLRVQYRHPKGSSRLRDMSSRTHSTDVANEIGNTLGIHNGEDVAIAVYQISFANHGANRPNCCYIHHKISFYTFYLSKIRIHVPPIEAH